MNVSESVCSCRFDGRDVILLIWLLLSLLRRVEQTLPQCPGLAVAVAQPPLTSSQVLDTFPVEQSIAPGSANFLLERILEANEAVFPCELIRRADVEFRISLCTMILNGA
jgi:hypothetical protein